MTPERLGGEDRAAPGERVPGGVPYLGMDWGRYLDGPQDLTFPSAMRAVMGYLGEDAALDYRFFLAVCGHAFRQLWHPTEWRWTFDNVWIMAPDPVEPIRRCFEAAGYSYEILGNREVCEAGGYPLGVFDEYTGPEEIRERVCQSLDAGRPVIAWGVMPGAAVIAGYEDHGNTLVGWGLVFDEEGVERDPGGYVRMRDWLKTVGAVVLVGDKGPAPALGDSYRKALLWAVESARRPTTGEYASGFAALTAWAEALTRDGDVRADGAGRLKAQYDAHHDMALVIAEGRAFGGEILRRFAVLEPKVAPDLEAAADRYSVMHDLMWRIWQTCGGIGQDEAKLPFFPDPAARAHLRYVVERALRNDMEAIAYIERALVALGFGPEDMPPASEEERACVTEERAWAESSGVLPDRLRTHVVNHWVDGVPSLAWAQGKDCTFAGALEAALAPTLHPVPYAELMGYSGLAFRTRWFQNPARAPTVWGDQRWHPVSPHGEGPEEIAAISRATGWQLRAEELPAAAEDPARHRLITDIVLSINPGLPVVVGYNTDCATVHGYHIHSMSLFLRDYQRPGQEDVRVPSDDAKLHSPFVYLTAWREPPPAREALLNSLAIAVRNGRREDGDGFRYGLAALEAWREDLAGYDGHSGQERQLLFTVNWWCLMHLADARQAAVRFLEARADLLDGESRAALGRALDRYRAEAEALGTFARDQREFIMWWGGRTGAPRWDGATRQAQQDLLGTCQALESQALVELEQVLASEGVARG